MGEVGLGGRQLEGVSWKDVIAQLVGGVAVGGEALGKNTSHSARVRMMVKPPFLSSLMSRYF